MLLLDFDRVRPNHAMPFSTDSTSSDRQGRRPRGSPQGANPAAAGSLIFFSLGSIFVADDPLRYAGFGARLLANLLDFLLLLPLMVLITWANYRFRLFEVYYFLPGALFGLFYNVYLVQRYGGTPGKLITGIRICKLNGEPIGYREAVLRYLPDAIFGVLTAIALILPRPQVSDADYHSLTLSR
jgi:hypothetical protein